MISNEVYFSGAVLTYFLLLVATFIYEYTKRGDLLSEDTVMMVLVSMVIALGWIAFVPIAILVGLAYVVAKLLILCREKWRNK